jgi:sugar phosphate isomerase/epimerase
MNIGLSLPLDYLIGAEISGNAKYFFEAFGKPCDCLAELKDHGIGSIELKFGSDTLPNSLLTAARSIIRSGMYITLHGYLPNNTAGTLFGDIYPMLLPAIDFLKNQQEEIVMTLHGHAAPCASNAALIESTTRTLKGLIESVGICNYTVKLAVEINRFHRNRIKTYDTTYEGILKVTQHLTDSEIGFCWDMGHTQSSFLQNMLPATPPFEFVRKVIHTHVHGLSPRGTTHWPLTKSTAHIASGVRQLKSCGYNGIYNLELYPMRWDAENIVRDEILTSIHCLQKIPNSIETKTT